MIEGRRGSAAAPFAFWHHAAVAEPE